MVGATWVADSSPLPTSSIHGNSQTGITLAYGGCITRADARADGAVHGVGIVPERLRVRVIPRPELAVVSVVTCDSDYAQGVGGVTYVNSTLACECAEPTGPPLLRVSPSSLDFGVSTNSLDLAVINDGGGVLTWNITESAPWLSVSPASGTGYSTVRRP